MTVEEILADLGVDPATIASKKDAVASWNGKLTASATEAAQKLADAEALHRVIKEDIDKNGINETSMAQLRASNAAMTAALAEVKKAGFTGITIPDFPTNTPPAVNPIDSLKNLIVDGFTRTSQVQDLSARYLRATGKPLPDDPSVLVNEAAARRMDVAAWGEQKYGLTAIETQARAAASQKEKDDYAATKVEEWKAAHPITNGHPELGSGVPSNYPNIPKPSNAEGVKAMAGKSPMEKIKMARDRVTAEVKQKMAVA